MLEFNKQYIVDTINSMVRATGDPALSFILTRNDIATREELRKLEHEGLIKSCDMIIEGTIHKAYYTEGVIPNALKPSEVPDNQPREINNQNPSESGS